MKNIGNRLKELRESMGWSVDEFANIVNIHRSSLYRYESGERELPISFALKICEKFNISLDWLAGTSDIKYRDQTPTKLSEIYNSLSEEGKKELFNFAMYLKTKEENK